MIDTIYVYKSLFVEWLQYAECYIGMCISFHVEVNVSMSLENAVEWLLYIENWRLFLHLVLHCNLQHCVIRIAALN